MFTTHEQIRVEAGFQNRFLKQSFLTGPTGSVVTFYVNNDDYVKLVPEFGTGNTVAGVSDIKVWYGASGVNGVSQLSVNSVDPDSGAITLSSAPTFGGSLTVTYASSQITSLEVEEVRLRAESTINQRLSLCYDLPISPTPSVLTRLSTQLAAAFLLIRDYGTGARSTAKDGYELYTRLMGEGVIEGSNPGNPVLNVGEIGLICLPNYQLVDDSGVVIPRNDDELSGSNSDFKSGGRVRGRLYDITEEEFRYKDFQENVDQDQPGTNNLSSPPIQG